MDIKRITSLAITALALNTLVLSNVLADTVETKCKVSSSRSKVSVDAEGLGNGSYFATVTSGGVTIKSDDIQTINSSGDEVEFDFDSSPNDIAEGATPIDIGFIVNKTVKGTIYNSATGKLVEDDNAICREKKRGNRHGGRGGDDNGRRGGHDDGPNHT
jgi:hypothetical protein